MRVPGIAPVIKETSSDRLRLIMDNKFDGDTSSFNAVFTDECVKEVTDYLNTKRAYIGTNGKLMASVNVDTVQFVVHNLLTDM